MGKIDADERTNRRGFGREWNGGDEGLRLRWEAERKGAIGEKGAASRPLSPRFLNSDSWTNDQSDGEKLQTNLYLGP